MNTKKEIAIAWALSESLSSAAWDASFRIESPLLARLNEMHAGYTEELESGPYSEGRGDTLRAFLGQIESAQRVVAFLAGE